MGNFPEIEKSRLRRKLLSYFFTNPQTDLYVREAAAILKEDAGNLSKEFANLEKMGIFSSRMRGRQKYFSLDENYPLFNELKSVIFKTIGVEGSIREVIEASDNIKAAFIYGSFARNKENAFSDIDLLVIGNTDEDDFMERIDVLEKKLQREINYNVYSEKEFSERLRRKDSFVINILKRPKIVLKGKLNGIQRPA